MGQRRLAWFLFVFVSFYASAQPLPKVGAVASAHPLATEAGIEILAAGGNAFDAAVAVSAALAVVEPYSSGIGGGGFWLLHRARDNHETMIDGRERAPLAALRDLYLDAKGEPVSSISMDGPLAAAIPGEPAALEYLAKHYGRLPLRRTLAPAIRLAREGFPVTEHYRRMATLRLATLRQSPAATRTFLHDDGVPPLGHMIMQSDLASTLQAIAEYGAAGFYRGHVAEKLINAVRSNGGIWRSDDLENYRVVERKPIRGRYHGLTIISAAPPSSGGIALLTMLNILGQYDLEKIDPATRTHLVVEAMRRAYRDRAEYLGDPDFVKFPQARLINPDYAAGLAASIRLDRATPSRDLPDAAVAAGGDHTTHLSILDRDGNYVAATLSINYPFGSGYVAEGTGVLLNNEMDDFSVKPGVPNAYGLVGAEANAIAPGKRPLSSMSPTFVRGSDGVAILGTPGGSRIITMMLLGILERVHTKEPQAWVSLPRFHHQYLPDQIYFEPGAFSSALQQELTLRGHTLQSSENPWGNMQAIWWGQNGEVKAASDPRGEGRAAVVK